MVFCAGLHCAMQINNKSICLKYRVNIFLAFICAVIAGWKLKEREKKNKHLIFRNCYHLGCSHFCTTIHNKEAAVHH